MIAVVTKEKVALPDGARCSLLDGQRTSPTLSRRSSCSSEMVIDKALAEVQNRFTTKDLSASEEQAGTKSTKKLKGLCID